MQLNQPILNISIRIDLTLSTILFMTTPKNIGKYYVVGELGRGATSVVYHARDPFSDRDVAIKGGFKFEVQPPVLMPCSALVF